MHIIVRHDRTEIKSFFKLENTGIPLVSPGMTIGTGEAVVPLTSAVRAGRACTNSVPQGCTHGKERQGRSVERATRAHSTVVHGYVMAHTAEAMPPRLPSHHRLALALSSRYVAQPLADRSVQRLIPRCRWTAPARLGYLAAF